MIFKVENNIVSTWFTSPSQGCTKLIEFHDYLNIRSRKPGLPEVCSRGLHNDQGA